MAHKTAMACIFIIVSYAEGLAGIIPTSPITYFCNIILHYKLYELSRTCSG